jgi:hypothetical protein
MAGFETWRPQKKARELVATVIDILVGPLADIRPVTIRQIYYRLIAMGVIEKTDEADAKLGRQMTRARRSQMIPMDWIADNGQTLDLVNSDTGPDDTISVAKFILNGTNYQLDRQAGQTSRLVIWTEAAGLVSQLGWVKELGIEIICGGGQPSVTFCHEQAQRLAQQCVAGNNSDAIVMHLGDWDVGGQIILKSAGADIAAWCSVPVSVVSLAVNPSQIKSMGLITQEQKPDGRNTNWTGDTCQLEAIDPPMLRTIVEDAIDRHRDSEIAGQILSQEMVDVGKLKRQGKKLTSKSAGRPETNHRVKNAVVTDHRDNPEKSIRELAKSNGVSKSTVARWLKE